MSSGIKKRSGSDYSDGRPGRINYHSEDEYRTVTLTLQATAEDMHDITHLRDAVNELFDGELLLREMRIKSVEVEYESMGQHTGEMQLEAPEYVNGKQIKVAMVNSPEIDDTTLVSTFTVEFETTELPYFETIYTTLELNDTGYSATAEKYGLVDNIDDEKVKYRFEGTPYNENLMSAPYDYRNPKGINYETIHSGLPTGKYTISFDYEIHEVGRELNGFRLYAGTGIDTIPRTSKNADHTKMTFDITSETANKSVYLYAGSSAGYSIENDATFKNIKIERGNQATPFSMPTTKFNVFNAGNVTVQPESMMLKIQANVVHSENNFTIRNKTTGEEIVLKRFSNGSHFVIEGMNIRLGGLSNIFRDTNRRFISLVPGDNEFEILNGTFSEIRFEFKYYYK